VRALGAEDGSSSMLSDKYLAGFLDADGCIIVEGPRKRGAYLRVVFSQKRSQDAVIHLIQRNVGGTFIERPVRGEHYTDLSLPKPTARGILERIREHLVVKRRYAEWALDVCSRPCDWEEVKARREVVRRQRSDPLPKHLDPEWMAGYFDGDGCFSVNVYKRTGNATAVMTIAAASFDTEGIELIHKAFGGGIFDMSGGRSRQWRLAPDASKLNSMLPFFVPYLIVKRDQGEFLLRCAAMGHLRDGENIKAGLRHLKDHKHRLGEPAPDIDALMTTVSDLPAYKRTDYGDFERDAAGRIVGKRTRQPSS